MQVYLYYMKVTMNFVMHPSIYDVPTAVGNLLIAGGMSICTYACMFLCDSVTKVASIALILKIQNKKGTSQEK